MQPMLSALGEAYEKLRLPLRSIENEWGPGQVECTFAPANALEAADNVLLFRTATRQFCRRLGYFATFMCRPALAGYYSSGWHLHQSLIDARRRGANLFMPEHAGDLCRRSGQAWLAGLLHYAVPATVFTTPTVNGYRRFRPNSLAPDRATWAYDHRGVMLRVLGGPGDPATRIENRVGEPAANPYLYIAAQIVAGLAGIDGKLASAGRTTMQPYAAERPMLPKSLAAALDALAGGATVPHAPSAMCSSTISCSSSAPRSVATSALSRSGRARRRVTRRREWEQNEYFDFF